MVRLGKKKIMLRNSNFLIFIFLDLLTFQSCGDSSEGLGGGYVYRYEGSDYREIFSEKPHRGHIPPDVISYDVDGKFIIAKQKPRLPQDILIEEEYVYANGADAEYFWIVIKDSSLVLGPMSETQFNQARITHGVPKNLKLK